MRRGSLLLVSALSVCILAAGCLNDFDEERLNRAWIGGIDVSAPEVSTGVVTLLVNVTVENREARSGDLSMLVKAYNTATGLLEETATAGVGVLDRDRTAHVPVPLVLPKVDGYRITAALWQDEARIGQATVTVSQVDALRNNLVQTDLRVTQLEFMVRNVTESDVSIRAQVYLTNEGAFASEPLRLQVKAREVSTGLLAEEAWADVEPIGVDETKVSNVEMTVPDAYNYVVQAVLWRGDHIVGTGEGRVQLLPTFTVPKDEEVIVDRPVVSDFLRDERGFADGAEDEVGGTPGPGALLLVVALGALLFFTRRQR